MDRREAARDQEQAPEGFWAGFEARFRPFGTAAALEDSRIPSRLPLFAGITATLNIAWQAAFPFLYGEPVAGWVAVATGLVYSTATLFYYLTGNARAGLYVILWVSLANNLGIHVSLGGFAWSGMALGWGVLVTAAAALFLGRRSATHIGLSYATAAVVMAILEPGLRVGRDPPAAEVSTLLAVNMFVVSLVILVPMVVLLVEQIAREQARANDLLLNVLPSAIARRLKETPGVIADEFEECTVLFADIVGFTAHSSTVRPELLVQELNLVFSRFDDLAMGLGVEKIKTIGDGYMAVAGAPLPSDGHVDSICSLALAMEAEMPRINDSLGTAFELRIGINTGSVVAGVIGVSRFAYDLWGDTVNVASRMESQGEPGRIQVTGAVVEKASDGFRFEPAGKIDVRGRGEMDVFALVGITANVLHP